MNKAVIFLLLAAFLGPCRSYAADSQTERKEYRDSMERETREDYSESQRLREERSDMLRKGYAPDQIRAKQSDEIGERRTAPGPEPIQDGVTGAGFFGKSAFSGVSSPKSGAGNAPGNESSEDKK